MQSYQVGDVPSLEGNASQQAVLGMEDSGTASWPERAQALLQAQPTGATRVPECTQRAQPQLGPSPESVQPCPHYSLSSSVPLRAFPKPFLGDRQERLPLKPSRVRRCQELLAMEPGPAGSVCCSCSSLAFFIMYYYLMCLTSLFLALTSYFCLFIFISATLIACKKTCFSERKESPTFNSLVSSCAFKPTPLSLKKKQTKLLLPGLRLFQGKEYFVILF